MLRTYLFLMKGVRPLHIQSTDKRSAIAAGLAALGYEAGRAHPRCTAVSLA